MSHRVKCTITSLVAVAFLAYFIVNIDNFKPLVAINFGWLAMIAIANLAVMATNGLFIKLILKPFNKDISIFESFFVSLISSAGNFFAPVGGGLGFRAIYLKKRHGLSYRDFISITAGNYVIVFLVNAFFGLLALFLLRSRVSAEYTTLVAVFLVVFIGSLTVALVKIPSSLSSLSLKNKHLGATMKALQTVAEGWSRIAKNKKLMAQLILITISNFILSIAIARMIMASLGFSVSLPALLLFSVLGSLSLFVNITPANLGVKEAIYLFSASTIGLSTTQVLLIALIDRGVLFFTLAIVWLYSAKLKAKIKLNDA